MRTSNIQLPSYAELKSILASENPRQLAPEKQDTHYNDFEVILKLLNYFKLPTDFFENIKFEEMENIEVYNKIVQTFDDLSEKILQNYSNPELKNLLDDLYDYLSEEDTLEVVDIIFVFGSKSTLRTETAIRLYKEGFAKKILVSGKGPNYENNNKTEAENLAEFAIINGVPVEDIILEKDSITVPDNVKSSLNLLESLKIPDSSFILINSPFAQRRGWAHFNKFSKPNTKLIRKNTDSVSEKFSKDGWYKNEEGIKIVLKEFFGIRVSTLINTL